MSAHLTTEDVEPFQMQGSPSILTATPGGDTLHSIDRSEPPTAATSIQSDAPFPNNAVHRYSEEKYLDSPLPLQQAPQAWREKSILTFDGGGIRGYAELLMLDELMEKIGDAEHAYVNNQSINEKHETSFGPLKKPNRIHSRDSGLSMGAYNYEYLPCHYFDYIAGTSTGGLIATMLSRWRMSVAECIQQYEKFGENVFGSPRIWTCKGYPKTRYSKRPLLDIINRITKKKTPLTVIQNNTISNFQFFEAPPDLCRTILVAIRMERETKNEKGEKEILTEGPHLFRSYTPKPLHPRIAPLNLESSATKPKIFEVCRATTAAPGFFDPQTIGEDHFCDGGVGANNPTLLAIEELESQSESFKTVVSFGTGQRAPHTIFRSRNWGRWHLGSAIAQLDSLFQRAKESLTDCEKTHKHVERESMKTKSFKYYRFNPETHLGRVKLDEWESKRDDDRGKGGKCSTLEYIKHWTNVEIKKKEVQAQLAELAGELVRRRRERTKDGDMWERYACCVVYRCHEEECRVDEKPFSCTLRRKMKRHLETKHHKDHSNDLFGPGGLEVELDGCREDPEFPSGPF